VPHPVLLATLSSVPPIASRPFLTAFRLALTARFGPGDNRGALAVHAAHDAAQVEPARVFSRGVGVFMQAKADAMHWIKACRARSGLAR